MKVIVFGATGNLGQRAVREGARLGFQVTAFVRNERKWLEQWEGSGAPQNVKVVVGNAQDAAEVRNALSGQDAAVLAAGHVIHGEDFARIVDTIVTEADGNPQFGGRIWLTGGAALLDIPHAGRRSIGLPGIPAMYTYHQVNYDRVQRSHLAWSVICPGPMTESPTGSYIQGLRKSEEVIPLPVPETVQSMTEAELTAFVARALPELTVYYEDVAHVLMNHLGANDPFVGKRVGIALPEGLTQVKAGWSLTGKVQADA